MHFTLYVIHHCLANYHSLSRCLANYHSFMFFFNLNIWVNFQFESVIALFHYKCDCDLTITILTANYTHYGGALYMNNTIYCLKSRVPMMCNAV